MAQIAIQPCPVGYAGFNPAGVSDCIVRAQVFRHRIVHDVRQIAHHQEAPRRSERCSSDHRSLCILLRCKFHGEHRILAALQHRTTIGSCHDIRLRIETIAATFRLIQQRHIEQLAIQIGIASPFSVRPFVCNAGIVAAALTPELLVTFGELESSEFLCDLQFIAVSVDCIAESNALIIGANKNAVTYPILGEREGCLVVILVYVLYFTAD